MQAVHICISWLLIVFRKKYLKNRFCMLFLRDDLHEILEQVSVLQIKRGIRGDFSIFLNENICYDPSLELSH